ncbi:Uncharacterized protein Adt_11342 [Abeliophyllum distichum]|uniref:Reverse transcriptase domain-containing protein n=1 Tax=Abeliophyllum distichum TaxID=126358 RepID=A0ABD1UMJ7_9LAMI
MGHIIDHCRVRVLPVDTVVTQDSKPFVTSAPKPTIALASKPDIVLATKYVDNPVHFVDRAGKDKEKEVVIEVPRKSIPVVGSSSAVAIPPPVVHVGPTLQPTPTNPTIVASKPFHDIVFFDPILDHMISASYEFPNLSESVQLVLDIDSHNESDTIWCFWNLGTTVTLIVNHPQFLHIKVEDPRLARPLFITLVYASCSPVRRRDLWAGLHQISLSVDGPWIIGGDFNVIAHNGERMRIRDAECRVDEAEMDHERDPSPSHRDTLHQAQAVLNRTLSIEEAFWKQKAGVRWTCEGDHNTQYFHSIVQGRRIRARIRSITSSSGEVFDSADTIQPSAVSFFQELLSAPHQHVNPIQPGIIPRLVSNEDNLYQTSTLTEVREAIFNIDPDNVVGPDGFSSHFFTGVLGHRIRGCISGSLGFFAGGHLPKGFAATSLSCFQSGTMLLDMAKAYDRMDWNFLISIMEGFGFDVLWIDRIRRCISECRFSILINGRPCRFFSSSRGLRQGDPILPLVFIIAANCSSRLLTQQYQHIPSMAYIQGGDALISNLLMARNSLSDEYYSVLSTMRRLLIMKLLKAILKKLEGIFARFLWDPRDDAPRLHWKRWKDLCIPNVEGGLGFRRL